MHSAARFYNERRFGLQVLSECSILIIYVCDSSCSYRQLQQRLRQLPQAGESCPRIPARIRGSVRMATHMHPDGHWGGCLNVRLESLHVLALSYFLESLKTELRSAECYDKKVRERRGVKSTVEDIFVPYQKGELSEGHVVSIFFSWTPPCLDFILQCIK